MVVVMVVLLSSLLLKSGNLSHFFSSSLDNLTNQHRNDVPASPIPPPAFVPGADNTQQQTSQLPSAK